MNSETKTCQNCKNNFVIEPEDFEFYAKINVPSPTFCPRCRLERRLAWYNLVNLYHRKCDLCKEQFVSMYPPEADYVVYCPKCWWGDGWDWRDYGRDYDFSKSFFEQFNELLHKAPLLGLSINSTTTIGSPYNNHAADLKDCYLTFDSDFNQECAYDILITRSRQAFNSMSVMDSENCYDCMNIFKSNRAAGTRGNNRFVINSYFMRDCAECQDCFMCVNLRNKKYCFKNEQLTPEAYKEKIKEYDLGSWRGYQKAKNEAEEFWKGFPPQPAYDNMSVNYTGSYVFNSKNCKECYDVTDCEDCKFMMMMYRKPQKSCYDITHFGFNIEKCYEGGVIGEFASGVLFSQESGINLLNTEYCKLSMGGENNFGCVSVRKGKNVILNKEYSPEDYKKIREKIIQHMSEMPYVDPSGNVYKYGEFFPLTLSPFPYNITVAKFFFSRSKENIEELGLKYLEDDKKKYTITISAEDLPDHIKDLSDSVLKEVIGCGQCGRGYRVIEMELNFYKNSNLPLPRTCPFCRINEKFNIWVDNMTLKDRICDKCGKEFKTHYSKARAPKILCKDCYQSEVV